MTKINYKIAILFALSILVCSVFLVGFTDEMPTVYAATGSLSFDVGNYTQAVSETFTDVSSINVTVNNKLTNYKSFAGYVLKFTISDFSTDNFGYCNLVYRSTPSYSSTVSSVVVLNFDESDLSSTLVFYCICPAYYSTNSYEYASVVFNLYCSSLLPSYVESATVTVELMPSSVIDGDYMRGYNAGIAFADSRVNENSASYTDGYDSGIAFADGRVNVNSASYEAGFNAGKSQDYDSGYAAGVAYADSRVNPDSASYRQGLQTGYLTGRADGSKYAQNGVWYNADFDLTAELHSDDDTLTKNYHVTGKINNYLANYTVLTKNLYALCEKQLTGVYVDGTVQTATLILKFSEPIIWNNTAYGFRADGASIGVTGFFTDSNGATYNISTMYNGSLTTDNLAGDWVLPDSANGKSMVSITLNFRAAYNTFSNYYITSVNGGYSAGYNAGYNSGYTDGETAGVSSGSQIVENATYQKGYNAGLAAGIAQAGNYTFNGLFSSVLDAPVKVFTSLFDFEFLGVNLKPVVLSLLSIAFFVAVWRLFSRIGG